MKRGFTIVELLIVIVVIAILAVITIVAYNGIQANANDSRTKNAVAQLEKALIFWSNDNGSVVRGGSGSAAASTGGGCTDGSGNGWFAAGIYTCSAEVNLVDAGLIKAGFTQSLPRNMNYAGGTTGRYSLMLYACGSGKYAIYYSLQNPSTQDNSNFDATRNSCGSHGTNAVFYDSYGMRGGRIVQLL